MLRPEQAASVREHMKDWKVAGMTISSDLHNWLQDTVNDDDDTSDAMEL